jgi:phosphoglycolate phosphatase
MPRLQGLIFDLDGTLLDSAPDLRQAMNLMLAQHSRRPLTLDEVKSMIGDGAVAFVKRAFVATGDPMTGDELPYVQQYIGYYRNIKADPSQIYPHVAPLLEKYFHAGVKLGVCTNKQEAASYRVLEQLGLRRYFEFIAGGDTFPVHKPNPEHLHGVITALDVPRENCVFVGDGINDVRVAKNVGIPCVVVTHGYGRENAEDLGADGVIAGFDELPQALDKLGFRAKSG